MCCLKTIRSSENNENLLWFNCSSIIWHNVLAKMNSTLKGLEARADSFNRMAVLKVVKNGDFFWSSAKISKKEVTHQNHQGNIFKYNLLFKDNTFFHTH